MEIKGTEIQILLAVVSSVALAALSDSRSRLIISFGSFMHLMESSSKCLVIMLFSIKSLPKSERLTMNKDQKKRNWQLTSFHNS